MGDKIEQKPKAIVYSPSDAAHILGIGKTKLYEEINAGRILAKKVGRRTLIPVQSLRDWIENLETFN